MKSSTKIGILGTGVEGMAALSYFRLHGYDDVFLFDEKEKLEKSLPGDVQFYGGEKSFEKMIDCDLIVRSPGIPLRKVMAIVKKNDRRGIQITSTTQYFMEHCPCPIVGVTGTKGKGTTSTLIYLMLKEAGRDVYLGGNIGQSPFEFLDKLTKDSLVVLEMSSFQLQDIRLSPHIAVMLGVTSDHLDYHKDIEEYREAKSGLVRFQKPEDILVFNEDYEVLQRYLRLTPAKKMVVSTRHAVENGAYVEGGKIIVASEGKKEIVGDVGKISLLGTHNWENVLPAACVAKILGVGEDAIRKVLYSFKGLPHRLEFVGEIKGVQYYDDSISTTPETSIAATYAFKKPVILIAGGSEKGADYTEWGVQLQKNPDVKMVILMGEMAARMEKALREAAETIKNEELRMKNPLKIYRSQNLKEAVKIASINAVKGDVVALSPAAASLDMFKNYKERGEKFKESVLPL